MAEAEAPLCSVSDCDGKQYKEGYCVPHYVELAQNKEAAADAPPPEAANEPPAQPADAAEAPAPAPAPADPPAEPEAVPVVEEAKPAESAPPEVAEPEPEKTPDPPAPAAAPPAKAPAPAPAPARSTLGGGGVPCCVCGKTTYPAELVVFESLQFHRNCFKCTKCNKKIESNSKAAKYEGHVYCRPCFDREGYARKQAQVTWQKKEGAPATKSGTLGGGGVPCATCSKTVYVGEAVTYETKVYHKKCLKCTECGVECTVNSCGKYEEKIYCKRCFEKGGFARKQAQVKFVPRESKPTSSMFSGLGGGGMKCTACSKTVYAAEAVVYEGKNYHNKCFKCENCKIELKVAQAEHKGPIPYCKKCYFALGLHQATLNPVKPKEEGDAAPASS